MQDFQKLRPINEAYKCVQGEGKFTGMPHLLIRLSGCKLRCQFANSFCDTWHNSWKPEKGSFSLDNIIELYKANPQIKHTMITGGGPTMHPELLQELCRIAKTYNHHVTIETEGSEFVQTSADCISLSPKLTNSTPRPGTWMPYLNREVTIKDKEQHEKWSRNTEAMRELIQNHADYQLKPVISSKEDLREFQELQYALKVPNHKCWLMPEGLNAEVLQINRQWLVEFCADNGYNYTDRLHVVIYGDKRGV